MHRLGHVTSLLILRRPLLSASPLGRLLLLPTQCALFSTTLFPRAKPLPPLPPLLEADITETFVKGTGPGGQVINKTSSAVQIKHHPTGIVVKNQSTRSRAQNRTAARRILRLKIEEFHLGDKARTKVKEAAAAKKKKSGEKKRRRKYRALSGAETEGTGEGGVDEGTEERESAPVVAEGVSDKERVVEVRADRVQRGDGKGGDEKG